LVYATTSEFRPDVSGPGYWVFTLARLAHGGLLLVNRGFVRGPLAPRKSRAAPKTRRPRRGIFTIRFSISVAGSASR
jgi:cytochrome oxidase assembly protein ShyY1